MMRFVVIAILCIVAGASLYTVMTQAKQTALQSSEVAHAESLHESIPPFTGTVTAPSWALFDVATGAVITGSNEDDVRPIASVTKLFTAAAVMESDKRAITYQITDTDISTEGEAGNLRAGVTTTPYALLFPLLLTSSNDAAEAIHHALGAPFAMDQSKLLDTMNLSNTKLVDASGLDPRNVSTARELAEAYVYMRDTYPHIIDITQLRQYVRKDESYTNSNPAHAISGFTGGKQGKTPEAHATFVGSFLIPGTTKEIGVVVLKSDQLTTDIKTLLTYAEAITQKSAIMDK